MDSVVPSPEHKPHLMNHSFETYNSTPPHPLLLHRIDLATVRGFIGGHEVRSRGNEGQGRVAGVRAKPQPKIYHEKIYRAKPQPKV